MKNRVTPKNEEIKLNPLKYILSTTDLKGNILSVNDYFIEVCKYTRDELIGSPHNIVRHPDMPKAIFHLMWDHIKNGKNITAVVKNLAKDGRYYWVITDFEIRKDQNGNINRYMAFRQAAPKKIVRSIEPLYQKLLEIEKGDDMKTSLEYLYGFLEKEKKDYNAFIKKLEQRSALSAFLIEKAKKLFK